MFRWIVGSSCKKNDEFNRWPLGRPAGEAESKPAPVTKRRVAHSSRSDLDPRKIVGTQFRLCGKPITDKNWRAVMRDFAV
jgi:hypothetical protein